MKRKSTKFAIVAILLTQFLAACGGDTGSTSGSQPTAPAGPTNTTLAAGAQPTETTAASGTEPTNTSAPAADGAGGADTSPTPEPTDTAIAGRTPLTLWTHSAGNAEELTLLKQEIADFNKAQNQYQVIYQAFPQGSY